MTVYFHAAFPAPHFRPHPGSHMGAPLAVYPLLTQVRFHTGFEKHMLTFLTHLELHHTTGVFCRECKVFAD